MLDAAIHLLLSRLAPPRLRVDGAVVVRVDFVAVVAAPTVELDPALRTFADLLWRSTAAV